MTKQTTTSVTMLIVPQFPLHALALCIDALRIANREALRTAFHWQIAAEGGGVVNSSAGVAVTPDLALEEIDFSPITVLLAAYQPGLSTSDGLLRWLRRQDRHGGWLGCVDTGALLLARAGLLPKTGTSVHPEALHGAREDFRRASFATLPFTFGRRRFSSMGGVATLDMTLALVEHHEGKALAEQVGRRMLYTRDPGVRPHAVGTTHCAHPALERCLEQMNTHIDNPLSLAELSRRVSVPQWTLRRLFKKCFSTTPLAYYRGIRLERGRQLLAYSHLSVTDVAIACGFSEAASFSHAFSAQFGLPPSRCRRDRTGMPGDLEPPRTLVEKGAAATKDC